METLCYFYHPDPSIWLSVDPLSDKYPNLTPYAYCANNPIILVDPDGRDWYETTDGKIIWDDKATSQKAMEDVKINGKYLGKNVLVGTHNRDENLNEPINSATFELYLESNHNGPSATINGNTVPADGSVSGTLAEGLYPARFQGRSSYIRKGKTDFALIINEGKSVPTADGSPKNSMTEIFFHKGNPYQTSLFDSNGQAYSRGCLTGPCMPGSGPIFDEFGSQLRGFNGNLYLRAAPKQQTTLSFPFIFSPVSMPIDNTYVTPPRSF